MVHDLTRVISDCGGSISESRMASLGNEFAMLEMRLVVAMIAREFELTLAPGQDIQPKASLVLRTKGPVNVFLKPVSTAAFAGPADPVRKTLDTQPSLD